MIIRKYKPTDFDQLANIYNVAHPDEFYCEEGDFSLTPWADDKHIMSILDDANVYVYEADSILGFCGYLDKQINWIFVKPECRGKGVASKLLMHVLSKLEHEAYLFVLKSNKRAMSLYENLGFCLDKEFPIIFQEKHTRLNKMVISKP
jgi:ribosomal protein S18 acetylase RimI-like enzyme